MGDEACQDDDGGVLQACVCLLDRTHQGLQIRVLLQQHPTSIVCTCSNCSHTSTLGMRSRNAALHAVYDSVSIRLVMDVANSVRCVAIQFRPGLKLITSHRAVSHKFARRTSEHNLV